MRAVVTGASGFIGAAVTRRLMAEGWAVAALVRPSSNLWRLGGLAPTIIRGSLSEPAGFAGALASFAPEIAIHCAWDGIAGGARDDAARQAANLVDALNVVEASHQAGARVWIGLGSQAEYGPLAARCAEDQPLHPVSLYGAVKRAACETAGLACAQRGMRFCWARVFATYGPGDSPNFLVPSLIAKLLRRERPALTAGTQVFDLLHVDDAASAIVHLATRRDAEGIFNLGSGQPRSVRSIAEDVRDAVDPALGLGFGEVPTPPGPAHLEADIGRLTGLGWNPAINWKAGLAQTVAWHREQTCAS